MNTKQIHLDKLPTDKWSLITYEGKYYIFRKSFIHENAFLVYPVGIQGNISHFNFATSVVKLLLEKNIDEVMLRDNGLWGFVPDKKAWITLMHVNFKELGITDEDIAFQDELQNETNEIEEVEKEIYGWTCPRCDDIISPFTDRCTCKKQNNQSNGTNEKNTIVQLPTDLISSILSNSVPRSDSDHQKHS